MEFYYYTIDIQNPGNVHLNYIFTLKFIFTVHCGTEQIHFDQFRYE
jgi:hypothetical protein